MSDNTTSWTKGRRLQFQLLKSSLWIWSHPSVSVLSKNMDVSLHRNSPIPRGKLFLTLLNTVNIQIALLSLGKVKWIEPRKSLLTLTLSE